MTPLPELARRLVEALPKCNEYIDGERCDAPATRHVDHFGVWRCDAHAGTWEANAPLPYAPALRALQAALTPPERGDVAALEREVVEAAGRYRDARKRYETDPSATSAVLMYQSMDLCAAIDRLRAKRGEGKT